MELNKALQNVVHLDNRWYNSSCLTLIENRAQLRFPVMMWPDLLRSDTRKIAFRHALQLCECQNRLLLLPGEIRQRAFSPAPEGSVELDVGEKLELGFWGGDKHSCLFSFQLLDNELLVIERLPYSRGDRNGLFLNEEPQRRIRLRQLRASLESGNMPVCFINMTDGTFPVAAIVGVTGSARKSLVKIMPDEGVRLVTLGMAHTCK